MRAGDTRRLVLSGGRSRLFDAYILGLGSIATQTVYIKLILSSQVGGELYAALAIGGWIASVATGAVLGGKLRSDPRRRLWFCLAVLKIPLAFFIFIYPAFFTGHLDPARFLPLVIAGIIPSGILYGLLFPLLIAGDSDIATVYRNEAIGSLAGGALTLLFSYAAIGGFATLFVIAGIEITRSFSGKSQAFYIPIAGLLIGLFAGPALDRASLDIRWPGFRTIKTAHGNSGLWALHTRENQLTITHNGRHLQTIPDRQSSEEALLWPLLFHPDAKEILLIGFEGIEVGEYLPEGIHAVRLVADRAFVNLGIGDKTDFIVADPLSYSSDLKYDIVNVFLHGGGDLSDSRFETGYFFEKCRSWLKNDGTLFVSAVSDENYIAADLGNYLSAIRNSLESGFKSISLIPGPRIGFVCRSGVVATDPAEAMIRLGIDSPYFNESLLKNRLAKFRIDQLMGRIPDNDAVNGIFRPSSVINYLRWVGSMFGRSGYLFQIYRYPYPLLLIPMLLLIPILFRAVGGAEFAPHLAITFLGSLGMASEIAALYLFQMLFGNLYLHVGMIIAVFMAGMAAGAHFGRAIKPHLVMIPALVIFAVVLFMPILIESNSGHSIAFVLLYILAMVSGFSSGGGFARLSAERRDSRKLGATLYGADLYGAMAAAIFAPGILIALGVRFLFGSLIISGLVILATLWYLRR